MDRYLEASEKIKWASFGRQTTTFEVGLSLLAIGVLPFEPPIIDEHNPPIFVDNHDTDFEKYLLNILGTAIQAGTGKLVTCRHVVDAANEFDKPGFALARFFHKNTVMYSYYGISKSINYIDPRSKKINKNIDLCVIPVSPKSPIGVPHQIPAVRWGDSTQVGVGDNVILGGYPYGTDLFLLNPSNRGVVQPSFFPGIISSIIPAQNANETRLLQLSAAVAGGISGGAVFSPDTGEVIGMIISGLSGESGDLHPVTYAIPSEVIMPFVGAINFVANGERVGLDDPVWFDEYDDK